MILVFFSVIWGFFSEVIDNSIQMYIWRLRLISQHECNRLCWLPTNWKHGASNLEDSYSVLLTVKGNVSEKLFLFTLLFLLFLPIVVTGTTPWKTNLKVLVPHTEYSINIVKILTFSRSPSWSVSGRLLK